MSKTTAEIFTDAVQAAWSGKPITANPNPADHIDFDILAIAYERAASKPQMERV